MKCPRVNKGDKFIFFANQEIYNFYFLLSIKYTLFFFKLKKIIYLINEHYFIHSILLLHGKDNICSSTRQELYFLHCKIPSAWKNVWHMASTLKIVTNWMNSNEDDFPWFILHF